VNSYKLLINFFGSCENEIILDYGCGEGDFIDLFFSLDKKPKTILAVDSDKNMIAKVKKRFLPNVNEGDLLAKISDSPSDLKGKFDKIICQNVLECVENKLDFINSFNKLMTKNSVFVLSHHDFDSVIYNSAYKDFSRNLIHYFADTKQDWMKYSDGQMGRKIPGLIHCSVFKNDAEIKTLRLVDTIFEPGMYGYLMAKMLIDAGKERFDKEELQDWYDDLVQKNKRGEYYFAVDLVVAICKKN
jgi:SAM-dependent methyltransferase